MLLMPKWKHKQLSNLCWRNSNSRHRLSLSDLLYERYNILISYHDLWCYKKWRRLRGFLKAFKPFM